MLNVHYYYYLSNGHDPLIIRAMSLHDVRSMAMSNFSPVGSSSSSVGVCVCVCMCVCVCVCVCVYQWVSEWVSERASERVSVRACVCAWASVWASERACVRVCVRVCVCVCVDGMNLKYALRWHPVLRTHASSNHLRIANWHCLSVAKSGHCLSVAIGNPSRLWCHRRATDDVM